MYIPEAKIKDPFFLFYSKYNNFTLAIYVWQRRCFGHVTGSDGIVSNFSQKD